MGKAEKLNAMLGILLEHDSANKWNTKWLQLSSMDNQDNCTPNNFLSLDF